jgi:hypothetical protein
MKNLLRFEDVTYLGNTKTKVIRVYSTHSEDFLGTIHWRNGWRHYVISYERDIDMSLSCLNELCKFMRELEEQHGK